MTEQLDLDLVDEIVRLVCFQFSFGFACVSNEDTISSRKRKVWFEKFGNTEFGSVCNFMEYVHFSCKLG